VSFAKGPSVLASSVAPGVGGVEVNHAMVHGGPFPATSDGRSTSVGTHALERFSRLIAYQNFPDDTLPAELRDANPRGIWRLLDGFRTRELVRTATR
jgi:NADP-dependent aldehyde dehydrogenase